MFTSPLSCDGFSQGFMVPLGSGPGVPRVGKARRPIQDQPGLFRLALASLLISPPDFVQRGPVLRETPVDANYLTIHPATVRTREKRNGIRDIFRCAEPLDGSHFSQLINERLRNALEKQIRAGWSRRYCVHGDVSAAQFIR